MSDDNNPPTLDLEDQIEDLPEENDSMGQHPAIDQTLVTFIALNHAHDTIKLTGSKTILGRNTDKCTPGAILTGKAISGTHCQISSRSMKDADAAIWITDLSSNGVWVNEKRIPKNEAIKIYNHDIISFTPGVPGKDSHAYMLMDKRGQGSKELTKRPLEVVEPRHDTPLSEDKPGEKKQKLDQGKINSPADGASNEEKEKEDTAFEREFECGICHEIMHRANKICPTCRQGVTRTKRDFKLNNLIALFLKTRPHMTRDDVDEEDEGAESDTSNIMPEPPRQRLRNPFIYNYDDEEDEEDEDDDDVDDNNGFPPFFVRQPTTCPCCLPDNNLGYICPPDVRLVPLPDDTNFQDYMVRRMVQRGHSQCTGCRNHIPFVNDTVPAATANRFQCKMCLTPYCGCSTHSVEDKIANRATFYQFLNPHEIRIILDYLITQGKTTDDVWREVKAGMDNGTFFYLGTAEHPVPSPTPPGGDDGDDDARDNGDNGEGSSSGANNNTTQAQSGSSSTDPAPAPAPAPLAPALNGFLPPPIPPAAPGMFGVAPGMFGVAPPVDHHLQAARGRTVTSSDNMCHHCSIKFFNNGPLYQWRKNLDPAQLPANVTARESCWYGRECRTQHNLANQAHATRLNHICEKTNRRR
ncbi:hypothetical protein BG006_007779 [Podila minutissima]|uniref:RING-type E3 ubiquitin transferase n=1 Tax=Podila minutissima TaxID=64525 RepID=A0A9P5SGW3_9FUNG|nr:hypothetical protein BG006_007779 [Podila minutissima]